MQITVTIPDELAAQVQARGQTPQSYVEKWIVEQAATLSAQTRRAARLANLEGFFEEIAAHSDKIPVPSDEAFSRESLYRDHD